MVKEVSVITIDPKEKKLFLNSYQEVVHLIRKQPGFHGETLLKVLDHENEYILLIDWDSIKAHTAFFSTEEYKILSEVWEPYQKAVTVRHGQEVVN